MKIDFLTKSIEMTQTTLKRASRYGTPEYDELRAILKDFPEYQIEVIRRSVPRTCVGITYTAMAAYTMTSEAATAAMDEFRKLRTLGANYAQIKKWFLNRFPDFMNPVHPAA